MGERMLHYHPDTMRSGLTRLIDRERVPAEEIAEDGLEIVRRYRHETHNGASSVNYWELIAGLAHGREVFDYLEQAGVMVRDESAENPPHDIRYRIDAERLGALLER